MDLSFDFVGVCWLWQAEKGSWYFITLPKDQSEEIKFFSVNIHGKRRGWGSVKVLATIGSASWETSIFPDSKTGCYLLPVKLDTRKKEQISAGDSVRVRLNLKM